jgi:cytochrome c biogenesis protein CcmG, thiol:disulfide interchange protein DsbE
MKVSKQWLMVGVIVAGLALGAAALVVFGPKVDGVEVGKRAPDYKAALLTTGDSVSIREASKDHVTLVNIWATWCIPCRDEMPAIEQLWRELGPKGLRVISVSIDDGNPSDVRSFAKEYGLTFEILHDKSTRIQQVYQTTGVPESFLLDRQGLIVKKVIGEHPWSSPSNQRLVADLLGGE